MIVRLSWGAALVSVYRETLRFGGSAEEPGHAGQNPFEFGQRVADFDVAIFKEELADGALVRPAALLDDGNCLANFASAFKVPEKQDRVSQIADIHGRLHGGAD